MQRVLVDTGRQVVTKIKRAPKPVARRVAEHRARRRAGEFVTHVAVTSEYVGQLIRRGYLTGIEATDAKSVCEAFDDFIRDSFGKPA